MDGPTCARRDPPSDSPAAPRRRDPHVRREVGEVRGDPRNPHIRTANGSAEPTVSEKKKPGPKPEVFNVPLPFEEAIRAALETPVPKKKQKDADPKPSPHQ